MVRIRRALRGAVFAVFAGAIVVGAKGSGAQDVAPRGLVQTAGTVVRDAATGAWHTAQTLSSFALGLLGVDYKFGGSSPDTGLDCSGLVQYVFQQVTGVTLPRTSRELSGVGEVVAIGDLKPGDLVFFNTRRLAFSHVGIYLGDNRFIHAPRRGREVEVTTLDRRYWQQRFNGARRLVGVLPDMIPALIGEAQAAPLDMAGGASSAAGDSAP